MKRLSALLLVFVLVIAACGDDDTGSDDGGSGGGDAPAGLVDDLTQEILEGSSSDSDLPLTDEQAACFATGLIDDFGAERMVDALQLEFEEFMANASLDERMTVVDTMLECMDFSEMMATEFGSQMSAESAECVADAFVESQAFRVALANSFGDSTDDPFEDPAVMEEVLPAMLECLSAEELMNLGDG